jgi:hypothetical protein
MSIDLSGERAKEEKWEEDAEQLTQFPEGTKRQKCHDELTTVWL